MAKTHSRTARCVDGDLHRIRRATRSHPTTREQCRDPERDENVRRRNSTRGTRTSTGCDLVHSSRCKATQTGRQWWLPTPGRRSRPQGIGMASGDPTSHHRQLVGPSNGDTSTSLRPSHGLRAATIAGVRFHDRNGPSTLEPVRAGYITLLRRDSHRPFGPLRTLLRHVGSPQAPRRSLCRT